VQASADPMYAAETSFHIDMTAAVVAGHVRSLAIETSSTRARLNRGMAPIDANRRTSHPRSCPKWNRFAPASARYRSASRRQPWFAPGAYLRASWLVPGERRVSGLRPARRENPAAWRERPPKRITMPPSGVDFVSTARSETDMGDQLAYPDGCPLDRCQAAMAINPARDSPGTRGQAFRRAAEPRLDRVVQPDHAHRSMAMAPELSRTRGHPPAREFVVARPGRLAGR